jgi:hypothetical protein
MKKNILTIFLMAALPSFVLAQGSADIVVTGASPVPKGMLAMRLTSNYIVRNLNGDIVCRMEKDSVVGISDIAPDGDRVKIQVKIGPCKDVKNGFVYVNYLRPTDREGQKTIENALVEIHGLSLRKEPNVEDGSFACSLPKNTKLKIVSEVQKRARWVEVEVADAPKGCPTKGWVSGSYIKPDIDFSSLHKMTAQEVTEASTPDEDCEKCRPEEVAGGRRQPIRQAIAAGAAIQAAADQPQAQGKPGPFTDFAKELLSTRKCPPPKGSDYKCNRGLMEMPTEGNAGFCGTHHYTPDRPPGVDTYTSPEAACSLVGLAQEWKKTACPDDNKGCRIAWGDISHRTKARFGGHSSEHTDGECIDIRPFNTGAFRDAGGRRPTNRDYDREATTAFIKLATKYGASIRYSDPKIKKAKDQNVIWGGSQHKDHMHVCFESKNRTVQNACNNLAVDPQVCSELQ